MTSRIVVSSSSTGLGVFAKTAFSADETIFFVTGPLLRFEQVMALPQTGENSIQIGSSHYVDPLFPGRYLNHSCDPNAGFVDDIRLIALRDISPGEEICFDYSTTMLERQWELECECGKPTCRKFIQDFDLIPSELQDRYLRRGVVQDFIVRSMIAEDVGGPPPEVPPLLIQSLSSPVDQPS